MSLALLGQVVTFPDAGLEQAIRDEINKPTGDILQSDLDNLIDLHADGYGISDLTGIENCTSLLRLNLNDNNIENIDLLSTLTLIDWLNVGRNELSTEDMAALAPLTRLKELWIDRNANITSIAALAPLTQLWQIDMTGNNVSDISTLSGFPLLQMAFLGENPIGASGLQALSGLTALHKIHAMHCGLESLNAVAGLPLLSELHVEWNEIVDLTPLGNLANLTSLRLDYNDIADITPLVDNTGITGSGDYVNVAQNYLDTTDGSEDMQNIQALTGRQVQVTYLPQRELPRQLSPFETEHFEIHFDDAIAEGWDDHGGLSCAGAINHECTVGDGANGWPDFVEAIGLAMEISRYQELIGLGYGSEGDEPMSADVPFFTNHDKYQVWIDTSLSVDGRCSTDWQVANLPRCRTSHILIADLRTMLADSEKGFREVLGVCAEEYFHAIQYHVWDHICLETLQSNHAWAVEGTAMWMSDLVVRACGFSGRDKYESIAANYLGYPSSAPLADGGATGSREYEASLYFHFLGENLQTDFGRGATQVDTARLFIEAIGTDCDSPMESLESALSSSYTFDDTYVAFSMANWFSEEWYPNQLPQIPTHTSVDLTAAPERSISFGAGGERLERYGCWYFKVIASGKTAVDVEFDGKGSEFFVIACAAGDEANCAVASSVTSASYSLPAESADGSILIIGRISEDGNGEFDVAFSCAPMQGDADWNGYVDGLDVRRCMQIAAGSFDATEEELRAADVDGNGDVDMDDVRILAEYVIGMRDTLP